MQVRQMSKINYMSKEVLAQVTRIKQRQSSMDGSLLRSMIARRHVRCEISKTSEMYFRHLGITFLLRCVQDERTGVLVNELA